MRFLKKLLILAALFPVASSAASKPNVVLILADDLGYGDVRPLNPESVIRTPSFDRLAAEGMTFTDAHTPSAVCTPTRYGLLCGRYCWRTRLKSGVLGGFSPHLVDPSQQTLPRLLQAAGYHTEVVGKWHLGMDWQWNTNVEERALNNLRYYPQSGEVDFAQPVENGPGTVGFTRSLVVPGSLDMGPYVYVRDGKVEQLPTAAYPGAPFPAYIREGQRSPDFSFEDTLDDLTAKASSAIGSAAASQKPFFLYFPLTAPHKPVLPHERFRGKSGLGPYGDFIRQVDWTVGEVLRSIDEAGIAENTLLIVTSDNGSFMFRSEPGAADHTTDETRQAYDPAHHTANGPLRGTKADIYEGGHRVPFFVRWPSVIEGGLREASAVCLTDVLATVSAAAGVSFDAAASPDSFSFLPLLKQEKASEERPPIVHHSVSGHFAVRNGAWKLILSTGSGGREKPSGKKFGKPYQLYNLKDDLGETTNLVGSHPEKAEALESALFRIAGESLKRE